MKALRKRRPSRERESDLVRSTLQALALRGVWAWRVNAGGIHRNGVHYLGAPAGSPDIMGVVPDRSGRLFGLEAKTSQGTIRVSQRRWSAKALQHGVLYAVYRDVKAALDLVEQWRTVR